MTWDDHWGSVHEAAHAVVARYFGLTVTRASMNVVRVRYRRNPALEQDDCMPRLIVSAAGDAATTEFLNWTATDGADNELVCRWLRELGADPLLTRRWMRDARAAAVDRVRSLKGEIYAVAKVLRKFRTLAQADIDYCCRRVASAAW